MSHNHTVAPLYRGIKKLSLLGGATLALMCASTSYSMAQSVPDTGGIADPSRATERFRDDDVDFEIGPQIEVREAEADKAPAGAENVKFVLKKLNVTDISVFTSDYIETFYADMIGKEVSLADIYSVAAKLTRLYRDSDYAISRVVVPVQTIDKKTGEITLEAVEGYIDQVIVEGEDKGAELNRIREYANRIAGQQPLNIKDLERVLLLINDLPGVESRAVLSESTTTAKATDLRIIVTRKKVDAVISYDTFGSRYLGPHQFVGATSFNSWLGLNERVTFQGAYAPDSDFDSELAYVSAFYEQPINKHGTWLSAFISATDTKPGFDLKQFDVEGHSTFGEIKLRHPITRTRNYNWYTDVAFDWRDVDSKNNIEPTRKDRIRAFRLGTNLEFLDTIFRAGVNSISLKYSKGLDMFGASEDGDPNLSREFGDPQFSKFEGEVQRLQRITNKWNLLAAVKGQVASGALLSSEEFGVGGINIGRAFDSSEIIGEDGISGKVEVQWRNPYPIELLDTYQLYGFYDVGTVWNDDATTEDLERESLASTGLGFDATIAEKTSLGMMVAFPLTRDVQTQGDKDPRFYFTLSREF